MGERMTQETFLERIFSQNYEQLRDRELRLVRVKVPGGLLRLTVDRDCGGVRGLYLTGPTNMVCRGEVTDEDLAAGGKGM